MTEIYPLPPPFSDDEILQPLRPHSDAPPPKRGRALTAGVAVGAAVLAVGLGIAGFALVGSGGPGPRVGTTAEIDPAAPKESAAPREPAATASVGPPPSAAPSAAASVAPWRSGDRIAGNLGLAAMVLLPNTTIHNLVHRRQW